MCNNPQKYQRKRANLQPLKVLIPHARTSSFMYNIDKEVLGVVLSFLIVGIIYRKEAFLHGPK
jgi:hypothetical protein